MAHEFKNVKLLVLDIDGVIYCHGTAVPGAPEAIERIQAEGIMIKYLTNDSYNSRRTRIDELNSCGFDIALSDLYTAASLTAAYLRGLGRPRTMLLFSGDSEVEFEGIPLVDRTPRVVVVGDFFDAYSHALLNQAFLAVRSGATFLATQKNRFCSAGGEPTIDAGFWVSGLEYCTGRAAEVIGKPSRFSYMSICDDAEMQAEQALFVSDDLGSDLCGAQGAGLRTAHLTDYYIPMVDTSFESPDITLTNVVELADMLCQRRH